MASLNDPKPSMSPVHEQQRRFSGERSLVDAAANLHVALTYEPLDAASHMARVKSPKAGAVVLFAGTLL
jgi:molybdopterin synthase catalytic subunit